MNNYSESVKKWVATERAKIADIELFEMVKTLMRQANNREPTDAESSRLSSRQMQIQRNNRGQNND